MAINDFIHRILNKREKRRDFIAHQIKLLVAGALFSWPLSKLMQVKVAQAQETTPKVGGISSPKEEKVNEVHPIAKQFIGQNLEYEITFLGIFKAAVGTYKFKQGPGSLYLGTMEAKVIGFVGKITKHRKLELLSQMAVKKINGVDRFVTNMFKQTSTRTDLTYVSTYIMNYKQKRYIYKKEKDGKIIKKRKHKIKGDLPYDDFVVAGLNFRIGAYGKVDYGSKFTVTTIPYKGVSKFDFYIATEDEMKKKSSWIEKHKDTKYMAIIKIDKKIFGIKSGTAYMLGTDKLLPIAAAIENVSGFGSVNADLNRKG